MPEPASFQELIRRVRLGDQDAATDLVRLYEPAIRRVVRLRLGGTPLTSLFDSMDVCQSVLASFFVRAAGGQYDLDTPDQLVKLLAAMARNKLAQQARGQMAQRRDRRRLECGEITEDRFVAPGPDPGQRAEARDLLEAAHKLLSEEEKQLVQLRAQGLDWPAVAGRLGGSAEALRKKLARALDRVAGELGLDEP